MGAPLGNLFALGNNGGKPPFFDNPEIFKSRVVAYFESFIDSKEKPRDPVLGNKPTTTGLAMWLGFESRQSLYDYKSKDEFSYIIKKASLLIEMGYEEQLDSKNATGAIFALKNMNWTDKKDIDVSGDVNIPVKEWV